MDAVTPFTISVPEAGLTDLRARLDATRWPDVEPVSDWSQGVPLAVARDVVEHWRTRYDWRRCERLLNAHPQYRTKIDGQAIHFIHVRSRHAGALPLLLTHGWPGSALEFANLIARWSIPPRMAAWRRTRFTSSSPPSPATASPADPRSKAYLSAGMVSGISQRDPSS